MILGDATKPRDRQPWSSRIVASKLLQALLDFRELAIF